MKRIRSRSKIRAEIKIKIRMGNIRVGTEGNGENEEGDRETD
jgi:hypothetical protein